jgi:hypothetical protein
MSSTYRESLDRWLGELEVNANLVYDIGASQEQLPRRVKTWSVEEYVMFDLEQPHKGIKPDVICDLNSGNNKPIAGYLGMADAVFCLEVMEYIYRPETALRTLRSLISKDGYLWVSFPTFYPLHQPIEDDCLRYMPSGVRKLADLVGLKITDMIYRRPETNALQQYFSAERLRAAKGEDHAFFGMIVRFERD